MQDQTAAHPVPLPLRDDTFLGVCEAIGQDFGFNANFLRVPLACLVLLSPWIAIAAYLGLGLVVLASRLIFPSPRPAAAPTAVAHSAADNSEETLSLAA